MPDYDNESPEQGRMRAWYGDPTRNFRCPGCQLQINTTAQVAFNGGFTAGIRWAITRTARLSPHIAKLVELLTYVFYGTEDNIQHKYAELYLAARDVWGSYGRIDSKLDALGVALANINTGEHNASAELPHAK